MTLLKQRTVSVVLAAKRHLASQSPNGVLLTTGQRTPTEPLVYSPAAPSRSAPQYPALSRISIHSISLDRILCGNYVLREYNGDMDPHLPSVRRVIAVC